LQCLRAVPGAAAGFFDVAGIIRVRCWRWAVAVVLLMVRVQHYPDGDLAVFHGPRLLSRFGVNGQSLEEEPKKAA